MDYLAETEQILAFLSRNATLASVGLLNLEVSGRLDKNYKETTVYYQHLVVLTSDRIVKLIKEIFSCIFKDKKSSRRKNEHLSNLLTELLPAMHSLAFFVPHAASSLKSLGKYIQEQIIVSCQHVMWILNDIIRVLEVIINNSNSTWSKITRKECKDVSKELKSLKLLGKTFNETYMRFLDTFQIAEKLLIKLKAEPVGATLDLSLDHLIATSSLVKRKSFISSIFKPSESDRRSSQISIADVIYNENPVATAPPSLVYATWKKDTEDDPCERKTSIPPPYDNIISKFELLKTLDPDCTFEITKNESMMMNPTDKSINLEGEIQRNSRRGKLSLCKSKRLEINMTRKWINHYVELYGDILIGWKLKNQSEHEFNINYVKNK